MKKLIILSIILILLTGCSGSSVKSTYSNEDVWYEPPDVRPTSQYKEPSDTRTWINPAIPIEISVTYAELGATAPWYITVHYGPTDIQRYTSITGNNTDDFLILPFRLYDSSIEHVQTIISSIDGDKPYATSYSPNTKTLWIDGLLPNERRTIEIWYSHKEPAQFEIYCSIPNKPGLGYNMPPLEVCEWVKIADPRPMMKPFETKDIPITLSIPAGVFGDNGYELPAAFEFRVGALSKVLGTKGNIATEIQSTWRVKLL